MSVQLTKMIKMDKLSPAEKIELRNQSVKSFYFKLRGINQNKMIKGTN